MNDCVYRQAAIDAIEKLILPQTKGETMAEEINRVAWRCAINCAEEMIRHLPSIEVEPVKRGRWIIKPHKMMGECPCCSECESFNPIEYRYCPNCGAKMGEKE